MKKSLVIFTLICASLLLSACKKESSTDTPKDKYAFRKDGTLQFHSPEGELKAEFDIEIVQKDEEIMRGLKFRDKMQDNQGMLFIFEHIDFHSFWMQDTYLSLDMIFIDHNYEVIHIEKNTTPFSEEQIFPPKANKYVLELLATSAEKNNIQEKDKVSWQVLEN
ncbi:MAG: DUF192 domain-containing protein [Candidatus Cloacimonadaceae bacterium]|jgi:uncharacterized membrane protein (UPF0127 family)|nr:DUF192 domain-containing protein [Candidatus Cloacimonadota bacterium]MCK9178791.1 DUF192 domain-containing protein [Candidatus Cloacimonadota bacterium]MDY0128027.1 DUF192 domain-containing protein [Candidatus Cloacimonadaceae bacterium]